MTTQEQQYLVLMAQAECILPELKDYLCVYWSDDTTDRVLLGMLQRGMIRLNNYSGKTLSYEYESTQKGLLFDLVRYMRAGCSDEFESDYLHELDALRMENLDDEQENE